MMFKGESITAVGKVPKIEELKGNPDVRVFNGRGRTLMSGLGDGHTHFTWSGGDLARLGTLDAEDHAILTAKSAKCFLDSGYTM
jgi:predicted amidohydrolase YtcJ